MKKSRIIALLTAVIMIMSFVPVMAADDIASAPSYMVGPDGTVYAVAGTNMIANAGFESGKLEGITTLDEAYEVTSAQAHDGAYSLMATTATQGASSLTKDITVSNASDGYYFSFWYLNTDSVPRRPRVTFAFTDGSGTLPTDEDFIDATGSWVGAGTASNDCDMEYSKGQWVKYSTIIKGDGSAACAKVKVQVYGMKANASYVDDLELYKLQPSAQYDDQFKKAMEEWESKSMPKGPLASTGKIELPREITSSSDVLVKWSSTSECIDAATGEYVSPAEDELVILTAKLYVKGHEDEIYKEYEYPVIVKSMFEKYAEWVNTVMDKQVGPALTKNLPNLPKAHSIAGYPDATIVWSCLDAQDNYIIEPDGTFHAPETTCNVNFDAKIICGEVSKVVSRRVKAVGGNLLPEGLEFYYDFDSSPNDGKIKNMVANGGEATITSGVTIADGYAKLSGTDSTLVMPVDFGKKLPRSYSVSMWVRIDEAIANSGGMYRFFDFGAGTKDSQFLRYVPSTGQLSFMDRGGAKNADDWALNSSLPNIAGSWKLITLTYDFSSSQANATVYVDGEKFATASNNEQLKRGISAIVGSYCSTGYIGRTQWNDTGNPDLMAQLDDVRVYSRALPEADIKTLYDETKPVETAPVYIRYTDKEGNVLQPEVKVNAEVGVKYRVPTNLKTLPGYSDEEYRYSYVLIKSKSTDYANVTKGENICTLVYELVKSAKGKNLIENGGFEESADGWTYNNNGTIAPVKGWARSDEMVHEGSYSLKKTVTDKNGGATDYNLGTYIPIEPGKKYELSWWEYSSADKAADAHQMLAAVVTTNNTGALGDKSNRLPACGGWDSWNQSAMGQATRDPAYTTGWSQRKFVLDTTNEPNAKYILIAYANGDDKSALYLDDFILAEEGAQTPDDPVKPDDGDQKTVIIKYVDLDGNKIKDDKIIKVAKNVNDYYVPESEKHIDTVISDGVIEIYEYKAEESTVYASLTIYEDNICTLVFDVTKAYVGDNLVANGSFDDGNGKFAWGTWRSPSGQGYFENIHSDYFYIIDRDSNKAALDKTGLTANDYALGTRWNDGENGLCSLANFIPVQKGVTYYVSYDYKHKTAGTDPSYIRTTFQTTENFAANDSYDNNIPTSVTTNWQTNAFRITAPEDGYIYFHFSWVGEGGCTNTGLNNGSGAPFWFFDNFKVMPMLDKPVEKASVTIKFQDAEGNQIADDETVSVAVTDSYTAPAKYKTLPSKTIDGMLYTYTYNDEKSTDTIAVTLEGENVITLVFDAKTSDNLVPEGSFDDGNGNFSWGTWQSPSLKTYFKDNCSDWFYKVDRTNNSSVLSNAELTAEDYALGTRWNDGTIGQCSMANFIPVEGGKSYAVSYDYKHKTAGVDTSYIRTTFQTTNEITDKDDVDNHTPESVTTEWQTNKFIISAPTDGYIYFHFSYLGESGNPGNGPYWYFDNFDVRPVADDALIPVVIKYQDAEGNELAESKEVKIINTTTEYAVPESFKSLEMKKDSEYIYTYTYNNSESTASIAINPEGENVCVLVFDITKTALTDNLIFNGSFEENADGWTYNNDGTIAPVKGWARSDEKAYAGSYSLKKTVTANNGGKSDYNLGTYIPIEPGQKYELSWWEYSSADKAAGSHQMLAAVVTTNNTNALGDASNRLPSCGGWDSWNNGAMGQATRDPEYKAGWTQRKFTLDTTNEPTAKYILIAYANGDDTTALYLDDFNLFMVGAKKTKLEYADGNAVITSEEAVTGYLVQAVYNDEGALEKAVVSDEITVNAGESVKIEVTPGAKLMFVESIESLKPITKAIIAK